MNNKEQNHSNTLIKITVSILLIAFGVISLIILAVNGISYTVYVPILMVSVAIATYAIISCIALGILRHIQAEPAKIHAAAKWSHIFSSGIALMILAPLIIILLSAHSVSIEIIYACFLIALSLSISLTIVGIIKFISTSRGSTSYILFQGDKCPCPKTGCSNYGNCQSCITHHKNLDTMTECERLKGKMERRNKK